MKLLAIPKLSASASNSILHYDGTNWRPQAKAAAASGVWGVASSAWGVASSAWGVASSAWGVSGKWPAMLDAVWGISSSDVFAVGSWTGIVHYDGTRWTVENTGSVPYLSAIWGSSRTR